MGEIHPSKPCCKWLLLRKSEVIERIQLTTQSSCLGRCQRGGSGPAGPLSHPRLASLAFLILHFCALMDPSCLFSRLCTFPWHLFQLVCHCSSQMSCRFSSAWVQLVGTESLFSYYTGESSQNLCRANAPAGALKPETGTGAPSARVGRAFGKTKTNAKLSSTLSPPPSVSRCATSLGGGKCSAEVKTEVVESKRVAMATAMLERIGLYRDY